MREWRTIKSAIEDALDDLDCDVWYNAPSGSGWDATCAYFEISINEDFDWEYVEECLEDVVDEWDLDFDWEGSEETLDLNASWDIHD